ncbi:hypothetical protein QQS21_011778 [Conoideocrella luteorostrata]|uniref:SH3 domain-containing protein n=1 Tax=Conoideocrella luteorostrata TaxID=1105319 RepID=A0AAJ0CCR9_9HYPO|nr:hypothetical protein QQS21_011778 [Conoideocrella luteorostrata]
MEDWLDKSFEVKKDDSGNNQRDEEGGGGGGATVIHTVYKTLEPTFEGPVAGYSTINIDPNPEPTQAPIPTTKPAPKPTVADSKPAPSPVVKASSSIPTVIRQPLSTSSTLDTVLAKATGQPTFSHSVEISDQISTPVPTLNIAATASPSASDSAAVKDGGDGTSAGAKAGIAFGVLGGVLIVGLAVFFLFNRRRKQAAAARGEADNEKHRGNDNPFETMTIRSDPHAPRISLRPVTQFLPNWSLDKRTSKGAAAALAPTAAMGANRQRNGTWDRSATNQNTHPANPFGNQAERVPEPTIDEHSSIPPSDPFTANGPAIAVGAGAGAVTAGAGAASLARKTSMRKGGQQNLDLTVPAALGPMPPSPAGTEFSMSSIGPNSAMPHSNGAAAIAAAGGPPNSNVHRVQLDFKPSLDDEMGMKAGDLVRLLHEYDDGWALCIRLDRSQQGVVPRTCLSTRPVKPRTPQGGRRPGPPINPSGQFPRGPGQRPTTPQGRPMTPQGMPQGRPRMGPGGPNGPGPRPMSPSGRSQSPGPGFDGPSGSPGSRPQSPMSTNRPMGGPDGPVGSGPAPMNQVQSPPRGPSNGPPTGPVGRKPVPGQAY